MKQIVQMFEGLGDNCEFGLIQRHFGAEPLGLLRFSAITPEALISLLKSEFSLLGHPDHTALYEAEDGSYMVEDDRGYYRMHTFIKAADGNAAHILAQQIKRLNFLKRELVEDLKTAEKIFVCKDSYKTISDATLKDLSSCLSAYGKNLLLGLRLADEDNPPGSIIQLGDAILIGHLKTMFAQVANSASIIDYASWQSIMKAAHVYKNTGLLPVLA